MANKRTTRRQQPKVASPVPAANDATRSLRRSGRLTLTRWFAGRLFTHRQAFFLSLDHLKRHPVESLFTIAVISIALALPATFYLLLDNVSSMTQSWENSAQISLFLKPSIDEAGAKKLAKTLGNNKDFIDIKLIGKAQALEEYRKMAGLGEGLADIEDNPLPNVLVMRPADSVTGENAQNLFKQLEKLPEVDIAQYDIDWVRRLNTIMRLGQHGLSIAGTLLSLAVLLIIGNTVRLSIYNQRDEIEIASLFGATPAFIRRPFLHSGFIYGCAGGFTAWFLARLTFAALNSPASELATLYASDFSLAGPGFGYFLLLPLLGGVLGLIGAWGTVSFQLQKLKLRNT